MAKYYSAADALVVSSIAENAPLVIAEALACGTPVIAFATGGIPEMIEHTKTGFLAEHLNTNSLAEGIKWLADENKDRSGDISRNCRKFALEEYSIDNQINKYMKIYNQLVSK
jgi:glycosyltransferase involved in cell wall biosynthesis